LEYFEMKKSLIALAALAVVGAASAQSTVTMYGLIDQSLATASTKNSGTGAETTKNSIKNGVSNGSRIGFKGTEDLGGGLKANFLMEFGVQPDEGDVSTTMNNRQSYVGLSGDFGAVTVGRQYTPYYNTQLALDQVGGVSAPGYVVNNHVRGGGRTNNAVQYTSPTISGFTGVFQVAAGDETVAAPGANQAGKNYGLSAVYAAGPLVAGFALDSIATPAPTTAKQDVWAAGASYDFNVAKAAFAYSKLNATSNVGAPDVDSKGWNLSVAVPMGATTLSANLGRANVTQTGTNEVTINGYQLRANYALSKRTTAYAVYGSDKTEVATVAGNVKSTQTSVGIRHTF
jgi:predicted porin